MARGSDKRSVTSAGNMPVLQQLSWSVLMGEARKTQLVAVM